MKISDLPQDDQVSLKACIETAKSQLARVGEVFTMGIIDVPNPDDPFVGIPASIANNKAEFANILRAVAVVFDAKRVVILTEAWAYATKDKAEADKAEAWKQEHGTLVGFPGVLDMISISLENEQGLYAVSYRIENDAATKTRWLPDADEDKEIRFNPVEEVRSRYLGDFTNLMPPPEAKNSRSKFAARAWLAELGLDFKFVSKAEAQAAVNSENNGKPQH